MTEGYIFSLSTFRGGRGSQVSDFGGGGGPRSQIFWGGPRSQIFQGGVPGLRFLGGYPVSAKGKNFDTRFGLIHVQTGKKIFVEGPPHPPSKGKIF